jgi:hypothetical protein
MISSPQDIPILAVLAMSLSMYVVGMVCICCNPNRCQHSSSNASCVEVTISGCGGGLAGGCADCDRLNGTFVLYKTQYNKCLFSAVLPPCFKTEGKNSLGVGHLYLQITSPTTAEFVRCYSPSLTEFSPRNCLLVSITNFDSELCTGSGTAVPNNGSYACGGSVSFHPLEDPCGAQTENDGSGNCCCFLQDVSQISITYSGWIATAGYSCSCPPLYSFSAPDCSNLNRTVVSDLVTYTSPYGEAGVSAAAPCLDYVSGISENCLQYTCGGWGLLPHSYMSGHCSFGKVCHCPNGSSLEAFTQPWNNSSILVPGLGIGENSVTAFLLFEPNNQTPPCNQEPDTFPRFRAAQNSSVIQHGPCDFSTAIAEIVFS